MANVKIFSSEEMMDSTLKMVWCVLQEKKWNEHQYLRFVNTLLAGLNHELDEAHGL